MSVSDMTETAAATTAPAVHPQRDFRRVEMAWLETHDAELQARHAGKWIAVDGADLIAVAGDLDTLLERARAAGHPDPLVTGVPIDPDELLYF